MSSLSSHYFTESRLILLVDSGVHYNSIFTLSARSCCEVNMLTVNNSTAQRNGPYKALVNSEQSADDDAAQRDASEVILWRPEGRELVTKYQGGLTKATSKRLASEEPSVSRGPVVSLLKGHSIHEHKGGQSSQSTLNTRDRQHRSKKAKGRAGKSFVNAERSTSIQEGSNVTYNKPLRLDIVYSMLTNSTKPSSATEENMASPAQPSQDSELSNSFSVLDLLNLSAHLDPATSACVYCVLMFLGSSDEPDPEKKYDQLMECLEENGFDRNPKYLREVGTLMERLLQRNPLIHDENGWWATDGRFQRRLRMAKTQRVKDKSKSRKKSSDPMQEIGEWKQELATVLDQESTLDGTSDNASRFFLSEMSVTDAEPANGKNHSTGYQQGAAPSNLRTSSNSRVISTNAAPPSDQDTPSIPVVPLNKNNLRSITTPSELLSIMRPKEPSNPIEILASKPWSPAEIHLLLDIVAYYPPYKFGWGWIAYMYNEWLIDGRLKEWALAQSCFGRDLVIKEEKRKQLLVAEAEANGIGIGLKTDFVPITSANTTGDPADGAPTKPAAYFWPRPDIRLPSRQAKLYCDLIRLMHDLREASADHKQRLTNELRALKNKLYEEIGGSFRTRTDWECWHRWCVPYVSEPPTAQEPHDDSERDRLRTDASCFDFRFSKMDPVVTLGNLCGRLPNWKGVAKVPHTYPDVPGVQQHFVLFDPRPAMAVYGDVAKMVAHEEWQKLPQANPYNFTPKLIQTIPQNVRGKTYFFECLHAAFSH